MESTVAITSPIMAPTITSKGVWPMNSCMRSFLNLSSLKSVSNSSFNTFACSPVALLTPAASAIITIAITLARANIAESQPSLKPIEIATLTESATWVLGIPPAPKNLSESHFFSVIKNNINLIA